MWFGLLVRNITVSLEAYPTKGGTGVVLVENWTLLVYKTHLHYGFFGGHTVPRGTLSTPAMFLLELCLV